MPQNRKLVHDRRAVVLLAEDSETDIELTRLAFDNSEFAVDLHVTRDGEQCLAFLRKQEQFVDAPKPDILIVDLHMPRLGGLEVLRALNVDEQLRDIPAIVLTTSNSQQEITDAYYWGCGGYLIKPLGFAEFARLVQKVEDYWLGIVTLPRRH